MSSLVPKKNFDDFMAPFYEPQGLLEKSNLEVSYVSLSPKDSEEGLIPVPQNVQMFNVSKTISFFVEFDEDMNLLGVYLVSKPNLTGLVDSVQAYLELGVVYGLICQSWMGWDANKIALSHENLGLFGKGKHLALKNAKTQTLTHKVSKNLTDGTIFITFTETSLQRPHKTQGNWFTNLFQIGEKKH